ncbi:MULTISPECIES: hypothetical protein [Pseudomonas]|uniref:hypothetical protein n=1 Tax=Pseudomonas TaxID=286 RepID=UPI0021AD02A8|nr:MULTISPECIES: hypothetical protein [Pseudomonas]MDD1021909.1 hypothetical protein [Pseudomonas idahonensis]MDP9516679.1 hypothetical protein [Pseudomonas protegens]MDP9533154.1 hypothetical protein [Pseudomonas protegens]
MPDSPGSKNEHSGFNGDRPAIGLSRKGGKETRMAFTKIIFKNPNTGAMKVAPVGFSWTVLLFGFIPALFRSDWKWAAIMFAVGFFTFGFSNFVFCFIYNKMHVRDLIGEGYKAQSIASGDLGFASANVGMEIPRLEAA